MILAFSSKHPRRLALGVDHFWEFCLLPNILSAVAEFPVVSKIADNSNRQIYVQ